MGEEDDLEVGEDELDLLTRTDEENTGEESETKNNIISGNKNHRYNLRPRKARTVNLTRIIVNKTELVSDKLKQKYILKQRDYNQRENFEITNFQLGDRFNFMANEKALLQHESSCLTEDCVECTFYKSVNKIAFQSNILLGYQKGFTNLRDTKIQKQGKRIKFDQTTKRGVNKAKKMKINWNCLHLANNHCIAMREVAHLNL